ncbi:MAG: ABC transporter permease [Candidatus Levybacteria bacterium]|nr:ABC transporter permease [Candidatus Levybacteria bacterium]
MNYSETFSIAIKAILANKMRSFLTVLGIMIGVLSVILLTALVSGLKTTITNQISGLGSNLIFVIPGKIGGARSPGGVQVNRLTFTDATNLKNNLRNDAEVSAVVQKTGSLKRLNKNDEGVAIFGVESNYDKILNLEIERGKFIASSDVSGSRRVAIIGSTVQRELFGTSDPLGQIIKITGMNYRVIGTAVSRGSVFGMDQDNSVLIPLTASQKQFGITNPNTIYISSIKAEDVKAVQGKAIKLLSKRLTEDDFTVQTQEQTLSTISTITNVLTIGLGSIAAISLIVGGIGIMNIMLVSVTERTREIGLRKALGAQPEDIRNQFLIEAITLSGIGGLIGIILGISLSFLINNFIQTTITWWSVLLSFSFSMIVGVIFGVAPAIRASKLNPIQALRYE